MALTNFALPLTHAQKEALAQAAGAGQQAAYIRNLIKADCESKGIVWPEDLTPRGRYPRTQSSSNKLSK